MPSPGLSLDQATLGGRHNICTVETPTEFTPLQWAAKSCPPPSGVHNPQTASESQQPPTTSPMSAAVQPGHPSATLATVFAAWKLFLLAIAAGSQVGPTYDTSSSLLAPDAAGAGAGAGGALGQGLVTRLTSWDAVYFVKSAQRGYLFEQEWAFSSALPNCISLIIRGERPAAVHFTTHTHPLRGPPAPFGLPDPRTVD